MLLKLCAAFLAIWVLGLAVFSITSGLFHLVFAFAFIAFVLHLTAGVRRADAAGKER